MFDTCQHTKVVRFPGVFEPQLVRNLKMVVDATGAEIVLSSDWRRTPAALEDARRTLRSYGIDCIGYTPCLIFQFCFLMFLDFSSILLSFCFGFHNKLT